MGTATIGAGCRYSSTAHARTPPGNWANTPFNSLLSLFRSWYPQTNAPLPIRLAVLDRVVRDHPEAGWHLLVGLGLQDHDTASPNATPKWRDDDAGAVRHPDVQEIYQCLKHVHELLIVMATGTAGRVAELVRNITHLHTDNQQRVWAMAEEFVTDQHTDEEREAIRKGLRWLLYWHRNFNENDPDEVSAFLQNPQHLYTILQPIDPAIRHHWLFGTEWEELPEAIDASEFETRRTTAMREALAELMALTGWEGVDRLIRAGGDPWKVGFTLGSLDLPEDPLAAWVEERLSSAPQVQPDWQAASAMLRAAPEDRRQRLTSRILAELDSRDNASQGGMALLHALPFNTETWARVDVLGEVIAQRYWETVPSTWCCDKGDVSTASEKLLAAGRPCAAFQAQHCRLKAAEPPQLFKILREILTTSEGADRIERLDSYDLSEALKLLAADSSLEDDSVIQLEFGLWPFIHHYVDGNRRIFHKLARDPEFFIEFLRLVYKSERDDEPDTPNSPQLVERADTILEKWHRVPGTQADGCIDEAAFSAWTRQALTLAATHGRESSAQRVIGTVLARAPADADGQWPCAAVRDVLDHPDHDVMRRALYFGLFNKRGLTSRALDDGGKQERSLAARYRSWADGLAATHWRLAGILTALADEYERHGKSEDADAAWTCES